MSPLLILIPAGLLLLADSGKKKARGKISAKHVAWNGTSWEVLPTFWDVKTAKLKSLLAQAEANGAEWDVCEFSRQLVIGETGGFKLPASGSPAVAEIAPDASACGWQMSNPASTVDYFDGEETVLFLQDHIAEFVADTLDRYSLGGELILMPSPVTTAQGGINMVCPEGQVPTTFESPPGSGNFITQCQPLRITKKD